MAPAKLANAHIVWPSVARAKKLLCNAGEVLGDTLIDLHILGGVLTECLHGKLLTSGKSA